MRNDRYQHVATTRHPGQIWRRSCSRTVDSLSELGSGPTTLSENRRTGNSRGNDHEDLRHATDSADRASSSRESGHARRGADRRQISQDQSQQFAQTIAVAQQTQGTERTARLQQLTNAVRDGTYKPDPQQVAESILDDAEIDARMQALLR